jgi:hypothetical protein
VCRPRLYTHQSERVYMHVKNMKEADKDGMSLYLRLRGTRYREIPTGRCRNIKKINLSVCLTN